MSDICPTETMKPSIEVNDIFEELIEENLRLNKELIFANKCLSVLIGLKDHLMLVLDSPDIAGEENDYKVLFPADVMKMKGFNSEFIEVVKQHTVPSENERVEVIKSEEIEEKVDEINQQNDNKNIAQEVSVCLVDNVDNKEEIKTNVEIIDSLHKMSNELSNKQMDKQNINKPQSGRMTRSTSGKWRVLRHGNQFSPPKEPIRQISPLKKPTNGSVNEKPPIINRKILKIKKPVNYVKPYQSLPNTKLASKLSSKSLPKITKVFKLVCPEPGCSFITSHRSNLRVHKMTHMDEKPFICKVSGCGKTFKSLYRLHFHCKTVHTAERNYRCEVDGCGKAFKSRMSLKQHSLIHSTLKYVCEYPDCNYKTPFLSNIRHHNVKHTSDRNFVCDWPQCNKTFKTRQYLAFHLKRHKHNFSIDSDQ